MADVSFRSVFGHALETVHVALPIREVANNHSVVINGKHFSVCGPREIDLRKSAVP